MQIETETKGAVRIIRPRGPLVLDDAEQLLESSREHIADSLGRVVIDAAAIPYVDSKGIESLLDLADDLADAGQVLKLCGVNENIREVLDLTEVAAHFEHFEDIPSAVRSFL